MIRNILRFWYRHINNISIKTKLLVFSLAISIIPLVAVTSLNYFSIAEKMKQSVTYSANQVFDQNKQLLENKISTIWSITVSIASDQDIVQYNLSDHPKEYYDDFLAQNSDYLKLYSYISSFQKYPEIIRAIVYASGRHMFSNENTIFFNMDDINKTDWYQRLIDGKDLLVWFPYSDNIVTQRGSPVVTALRKIRNLDNYSDILGILRIDMPISQIDNIVDTNAITPNSYAFILNSSDQVIYSNLDIQPLIDIRLDYNTLRSEYKNSNIWYSMETNYGSYILKCTSIVYTDWIMVMMIPQADLLALSNKTRDDMILVALITSLIVGILAYLFSYTITRRIRLLGNRMYSLDSNLNDVALRVDSQDELGKLHQSFNEMLSRIQTLMKEEHRLGQEVKSMELKALQAQINPHFLYNTLDLINWRAMNKGVPEISKIVQALAKFYKLGLSRGEDVVLLKNEIEHVRMFITIQNERFNNMLEFEADVQENVMDCKILKLLLQPLVENSIIHGIMKKASMKGHIFIKAFEENDSLKIIVEDDGNGMSEEQIGRLLTTSSSDEHYGVKNINERIKLQYGPEFSLQYSSAIGKGTTVTISLPIIK
jgi:two-component system, sensor histidine kinase YesM